MEIKQGFLSVLKEEVVRGLSPRRLRAKWVTYYEFASEVKNSSSLLTSLILRTLTASATSTHGGIVPRRAAEKVPPSSIFGDRDLQWTIFNEANVFVLGGYDGGMTHSKSLFSSFRNEILLYQ